MASNSSLDASMSDIALGTPPPGVQSNFIDPPSQKAFLISTTVIFSSLMLFSVAIRLYVKGRIKRNLGWDDWTCAISALTSIISSVLLLNAMKVGIGKHLWDIRLVTFLNTANYLQTEIIFPLYTIAIYFIKLSILLLYLKVFSMGRVQRYFAYFGLVSLGLFYGAYLVILIVQMVQCPTAISFGPLCGLLLPLQLFQAVIGVVTDIYILVLPIPKILKLQISAEKKASLLLVFGTGALTCGISIARLGLVAKFANKATGDLLWNVALTSELAMIELNVGIIAACAPSISAFLTHLKLFNYSLQPKPEPTDSSRYASNTDSQMSNMKTIDSGSLGDMESSRSGETSPGWDSHKSWLVLDEGVGGMDIIPTDMMPTYR